MPQYIAFSLPEHRALYNRRNFLLCIIPPPFYVLFITNKKIVLNNVKVELFENALCYQMYQKWGDNLMKVCPSIQWSLA